MTKSFKIYLCEKTAREVASKIVAKKVTVECRYGCEWLITIYN